MPLLRLPACEAPEACAPVSASSSGSGNGSGQSPEEQLRAALAAREPRLAQRLAATGDAPLDTTYLSRWLAARGGSLEAAAAGILANAQWREALVAGNGGDGDGSHGSAGADGVSEASIADELAARKVFLQGLDASGCPVVVVQAARWVAGAGLCTADPFAAVPPSWAAR